MTSPSDNDVIARELQRLAEQPLSSGELLETQDDLDLRTVETLVGLSEPLSEPAELTELDRRRVWRRVAGLIWEGRTQAGSPGHVRPHVWRTIVVGLSVAAGFVLLTRPPAPTAGDGSSSGLQELAAEARRGLDALEGPTGSQRARQLAQEYGERLGGQQ